MPPTRRALLGSVAASLTLAGCLTGGSNSPAPGGQASSPTDGESPTGTATPTDESAATVQVRTHAEYGDVLVGPEGLTLYMFDRDTQGSAESACTGGCASTWPPLTVDGTATAGGSVTAELDTFQRSDGSTQVAVGGWPLYYYASDERPGDATGQGVGDVWWVLGPGGEPKRPATATPTPSPGSGTPTPTESSGGGGGGDGDGGGGYY